MSFVQSNPFIKKGNGCLIQKVLRGDNCSYRAKQGGTFLDLNKHKEFIQNFKNKTLKRGKGIS